MCVFDRKYQKDFLSSCFLPCWTSLFFRVVFAVDRQSRNQVSCSVSLKISVGLWMVKKLCISIFVSCGKGQLRSNLLYTSCSGMILHTLKLTAVLQYNAKIILNFEVQIHHFLLRLWF